MLPDLGVHRALLLQGPMGPFFRRLGEELREQGIEVTKVNLNGGDALYYPSGALAYRGSPEAWPAYVRKLITDRRIDGVFVFGDGRPYHRKAIEVACELGVEVFVLEEGYLRPDYITLERGGVNGYSRMPKDPALFRSFADADGRIRKPSAVGHTFAYGAWHSTVYSIAMWLGWFFYPRYRHHRTLHPISQAYYWVRSGVRKLVYKRRERDVTDRLIREHDHAYFLVALQVHSDYQLQHSRFGNVEAFIEEVVASFAAHAAKHELLVIKHHPMDRAYTDYAPLVRRLAAQHGLGERLVYVHDLHLPTLLRHSRGAVMINSTVGLTAIQYGTPVKVLGNAIYDMPGITFQGPLEAFWRDPGVVDQELYQGFRNYLLLHNQANGNLMRRLPGDGHGPTGVRWFETPPQS